MLHVSLRPESMESNYQVKTTFWPLQPHELMFAECYSQRLNPAQEVHGVFLLSLFILDSEVVFLKKGPVPLLLPSNKVSPWDLQDLFPTTLKLVLLNVWRKFICVSIIFHE